MGHRYGSNWYDDNAKMPKMPKTGKKHLVLTRQANRPQDATEVKWQYVATAINRLNINIQYQRQESGASVRHILIGNAEKCRKQAKIPLNLTQQANQPRGQQWSSDSLAALPLGRSVATTGPPCPLAAAWPPCGRAPWPPGGRLAP